MLYISKKHLSAVKLSSQSSISLVEEEYSIAISLLSMATDTRRFAVSTSLLLLVGFLNGALFLGTCYALARFLSTPWAYRLRIPYSIRTSSLLAVIS